MGNITPKETLKPEGRIKENDQVEAIVDKIEPRKISRADLDLVIDRAATLIAFATEIGREFELLNAINQFKEERARRDRFDFTDHANGGSVRRISRTYFGGSGTLDRKVILNENQAGEFAVHCMTIGEDADRIALINGHYTRDRFEAEAVFLGREETLSVQENDAFSAIRDLVLGSLLR